MNVKRKGSAGERELLALLTTRGYDATRNDQRFIGGAGNPDIRLHHAGRDYHCEVKRVERLNLHEAIRQAEHDAKEGSVPCVVHRRNREPWYITLKLDDFLERRMNDRPTF